MKNKGFTLIEIVLALAVFAIILATALGTRGRMQSTSWARQTAADMSAIREAGLRYYWQNGSFPCCWYQLSGYLSSRLVSAPANPYGYGYSFSGSGLTFQVSTGVPKSVEGNLGLEGVIRTAGGSVDTITTSGTVEIGNIGGIIYEKDTGWSG